MVPYLRGQAGGRGHAVRRGHDTLSPGSSVQVHFVHADGDSVVVEHSGRNALPGGRRYDNNYCWVFRFHNGLIQEVREYMDTQLVTETFGADQSP